MGRTPRRTGGKTKVILIVAAACLLIAVGVCCLFGRWAMDFIPEEVQADLRDNPVMLEHIGAIEEIEIDLMASGEAEGDETFVFEVKGTKGDGVLTAEVVTTDEGEKVVSGSIRLPSGESYDLFPEQTPEAPGPGGSDD